MGVIAPDTCSGHISDAARPFRKLVPKPELASIAGGEDHGLCTGVVLTDARPSLKHENGPATAATSTVSASTPWQHEPAAALGMYTAAVPQVDLPTRKRKRQDASRVHESIKPRRAGEATKNQRAAPLVNGKRSCTVTQHAGQGPDGPKVVFSIPPTSTRLAPTASTSEPLSDLERSQSSYSVKFPNEDGCGALAGLSQGGIICENSVYRMDINSNLFRPINSSVARYPTRTTTPRVQLPSRTSLQSNYPGTTLVQTSEHSTQANLDITNNRILIRTYAVCLVIFDQYPT
ncbi:hypothetical protein BGX38DRAFT_421919 [Terfezia claveryi]|nr:hypothetical protein BGX38DRAFT_421919 [Terfezia claveryi]